MPVLTCTTAAPAATNTLAVIRGRLITLDHVKRQLAGEIADRAFEQGCLSGARRTDEVERENLAAGEPGPVYRGQIIVLFENSRLDVDEIQARTAASVMRMGVVIGGMTVRFVMIVVVGMRMM